MHDRKFSPERKDFLDSPERTKEYDIQGIISGMGLKEEMCIADIGAGTGFFSIPFSEAVGGKGKIFAVDISREMLDVIEEKVKSHRITNIETVLSTENRIPIPDSRADLTFLSNVFHELEGDGTLREILRILKNGGRLAVIDYKKRREEGGPPYHHRLSRRTVIARCKIMGLDFVEEFDTGSDRRYGLLFFKR